MALALASSSPTARAASATAALRGSPAATVSGAVAPSLNDAIGFKSCLRDGTQKFPTESKPRLQTAMQDNAVLQGAARVWCEPVLLFNDDTKDCFNQIFLHPSEIWKTSVLWLKLSEIASECQYILTSPSTSSATASATLAASRSASATLPSTSSLVAWTLSCPLPRRRSCRLPFLRSLARSPSGSHSPHRTQRRTPLLVFHIHGRPSLPVRRLRPLHSATHMLARSHEVTTMVGLRMAIAEKRQAGHGQVWWSLYPPEARQNFILAGL